MHHIEFNDVSFNYNSDYSGEVQIITFVNPNTEMGRQVLWVPFSALASFVDSAKQSTAHSTGFRAGIEAAARVCNTYTSPNDGMDAARDTRIVADSCAAAIRAIKVTE